MNSTTTRCVIALDVGGTSMKGALVEFDDLTDPAGGFRVHARKSYPTGASDGLDAVVSRMAAACSELSGRASDLGLPAPVAAGLAVPGIVDEAGGVAVTAANLPFRNTPLMEMLSERIRLPVVLGHDVRTGGLAEHVLGAAKGATNAIFLPLGTGIAATCIVDGRTLVADGYAGEIGHLTVAPGGEPCPCGGRGCLERIASASAIARRYTARSGVEVDGSAAVAGLVRDGADPVARQVWDEAVDALVFALRMAVTLLGSEVIVIGGGLAESGDLLLAPLAERLDAELTFQRKPRVVPAELGDQAGCLGAALLAAAKVADPSTPQRA